MTMPQVSRAFIKPEIWQRIFDLFLEALSDISGKNSAQEFVDFMFTPTEKIMFAKRLVIAIMLENDMRYEEISQAIGVSRPTIASMKNKLATNAKSHLLVSKLLKGEKVTARLLDLTEMFGKMFKRGKGGSFWYEIEQRARKKKHGLLVR